MAGYNEIQAGRFNRALQKALSMKGPAAMNELASILQANVTFLWGVEMRWLEDWDRHGIRFAVPAQGAGVQAAFRFRNPRTSNAIVVLEKIAVVNQGLAVDSYILEIDAAPLGIGNDLANLISGNTVRFDPRYQASGVLTNFLGNSGMAISFGTAAVSNPIHELPAPSVVSTGDFITDEFQQIPLIPGFMITVRATSLNTGMAPTFWWRQRALEDSEKK